MYMTIFKECEMNKEKIQDLINDFLVLKVDHNDNTEEMLLVAEEIITEIYEEVFN